MLIINNLPISCADVMTKALSLSKFNTGVHKLQLVKLNEEFGGRKGTILSGNTVCGRLQLQVLL